MAQQTPSPDRYQLRIMSLIVLAVTVGLVIWSTGLVRFVNLIPRKVMDTESTTDAIIVLTGGSLRLETGLKLLQNHHGKKLFISGVHRGVDVEELLKLARSAPEELDCCISLGYSADNTTGNARETANWMREQGFNSLRLVTANYHMPRSIVAFQKYLPEVIIFGHPVFPDHVKVNDWWLWPGTTSLIIGEYNKYLVARARWVLSG